MPVPSTKNVHKQLGKGINYRETSGKFRVSSTTACEKTNAEGNDENLSRLVPVPRHGARVLPLELVAGHGAKISVRVPTKGYVRTGAPV